MARRSYELLVFEIGRIITSPYPSQLRSLYDIVVFRCNNADISRWVGANPCLVQTLASCLLEGLQRWSYVIDIVSKLALNPSCRDAFLNQEPTLLHSVLVKAIKTVDTTSSYAKAAICLLATPLPNPIVLPTEAQAFFIQLVEEAAKHPSVETIEPVYLILRGTGNLLLGVLNTGVLIRFESHLIKILRNSSDNQKPDHGLSLYCLSIFNVVCCSVDPDFRLTAISYSSSDFLAGTPMSSRWNAEAMQQFFTGSKAQKSISLIVALLLWATNKPSGGEVSDEKFRTLVLVNEVITAIPPDLKKDWCTANTVTVHRLQEKLCDESQDECARTLGLRFLGKLCELESLPRLALESIKSTFLEPNKTQVVRTLLPRVDDRGLFSSILDRDTIGLLLRTSVEYVIRAESADLVTGLDAVTKTISEATAIIGERKSTEDEIKVILNDAAFTRVLQCLRDTLELSLEHQTVPQTSGWCNTALHRQRSTFAHRISELLLRASHSSTVDPQSMTLLLSLHASSARAELRCAHKMQVFRDPIHLEEGLDEDIPDQTDWRDALNMHFRARAQVEQDAVSKLFAQACAQLEARCENVEKPLRVEKEKRRGLEEHQQELTRAFAEMEAHNIDLTIQLRSLEEERNDHAQNLEHQLNDNADLLRRVAQLEQKLREAHVDIEKQFAEFQEAKQIIELDGAAVIARRQEDIEDLQEQLSASIEDVDKKAREASALQCGLNTARSDNDRLVAQLASKDVCINDLQETVIGLDQSNADLRAANSRLESNSSVAHSDLAHASQEVLELKERLQTAANEREELKVALNRDTEEVRKTLQIKIEDSNRSLHQLRETKEDLEQRFGDLQEEFRTSRDQFTLDLQAKTIKMNEMKKRTDRLQQKCEQKDQQIAEAGAMRTNLMAAMGLSNNHGQLELPHRGRQSTAQLMQTQNNLTPPTPTSESAIATESPAANISFASNASSQESRAGPTPKRLRPRRPVIAAPPSKTRASTGTRTAQTSLQINRRQTLAAVSGNRSGKPTSLRTPSKGAMAEAMENDDDSTFEGSEIFTSTQGARMLDQQAACDENFS